MYHINYIYNHMGLQGGREPKILENWNYVIIFPFVSKICASKILNNKETIYVFCKIVYFCNKFFQINEIN